MKSARNLILGAAAAAITALACAGAVSATECEKLPPSICWKSVKCTLDCERMSSDPRRCAVHANYFCRREQGSCEQSVNQSELTKADCEAKGGNCLYEPPNCFCPCDFDQSCNCACGGGPPANCVDKR